MADEHEIYVYETEKEEFADEVELNNIWLQGSQSNKRQLMLPSEMPDSVWKCIKGDETEFNEVIYISH